MFDHITHILLDAARMGVHMQEAQELNKEHDSLYRGRSGEAPSEVAPYIFSYNANSAFAAWHQTNGWGKSWGAMIKSALPMAELFTHFRQFLMVKTAEGGELYFRFYDPRVLRAFLPTCDKEQLTGFFGPIDYIMVEGENPAFAIRYRLENDKLITEKFAIDSNGFS